MIETLAALVGGMLIGYSVGWRKAHDTVATECKRLGKFYVDDTVFTCTSIKDGNGDHL